jgi:hypothetical protein
VAGPGRPGPGGGRAGRCAPRPPSGPPAAASSGPT